MRTFVISDIHGQYGAYRRLLEEIDFKSTDFMYVLGDVIDRGNDGIEVIRDLMRRDNVELFLGNHELMMLNSIAFERKARSGSVDMSIYAIHYTPLELWTHPSNGGTSTHQAFYMQSQKEQDEMEKYLRELPLIRRVKVGGRSYHLSHSYSLHRKFGNELYYANARLKEPEHVVWESIFDEPDFTPLDRSQWPFFYKRDTYIVGHVFTQRLGHVNEEGQGNIFKGKYRGYKVINIDCGLALRSKSSRLGCLQLENEEETYVTLEDSEREDE